MGRVCSREERSRSVPVITDMKVADGTLLVSLVSKIAVARDTEEIGRYVAFFDVKELRAQRRGVGSGERNKAVHIALAIGATRVQGSKKSRYCCAYARSNI